MLSLSLRRARPLRRPPHARQYSVDPRVFRPSPSPSSSSSSSASASASRPPSNFRSDTTPPSRPIIADPTSRPVFKVTTNWRGRAGRPASDLSGRTPPKGEAGYEYHRTRDLPRHDETNKRKREGTMSAVRPGILSHLVTGRGHVDAFQAAVMADEAGDFEIAETDTRVEGHVPVLADRGRREGKARTWRDVDTSNLPPLKKEDVKFFPLPADFDNTITAATSRRTERISVRYPLFIGTSMPASHVPGGGALFPPPFVPPLHAGVFPDGMAANSREREHLARRSNDARAGTGFVFPTPGSARVFVLASKARALKLVINRSDDVPPLNHNRVYSFVLHPSIHDAPFKDICETVEKAIREMDRKLKPTPRGQPRWTTHKS